MCPGPDKGDSLDLVLYLRTISNLAIDNVLLHDPTISTRLRASDLPTDLISSRPPHRTIPYSLGHPHQLSRNHGPYILKTV